ncbi:unnamed protein product [Lota lota]
MRPEQREPVVLHAGELCWRENGDTGEDEKKENTNPSRQKESVGYSLLSSRAPSSSSATPDIFSWGPFILHMAVAIARVTQQPAGVWSNTPVQPVSEVQLDVLIPTGPLSAGPRTCSLTLEPAGPMRGGCGESDSSTLAFANASRRKLAMKGKSEVIIFIISHGINRGDRRTVEEKEGWKGGDEVRLVAHRLGRPRYLTRDQRLETLTSQPPQEITWGGPVSMLIT